MNIPLLAGTVSTVLFAASMLPMLLKAVRTKDLESYSVGNIATTNVANAVHSFYVFDLPAGPPVWLLHSFYVVASASCSCGACATGRFLKTHTKNPSENQ